MKRTSIRIKKSERVTSSKIVKQKGGVTIIDKKEVSIKTFIRLAIETKGKCYMLSFDTPDRRSCKVNDIIAELLKNGYLTSIEPVLKNSILFLSPYNLSPINKFIHKNYPNLKFVLVRLNRNSYPALKYCY